MIRMILRISFSSKLTFFRIIQEYIIFYSNFFLSLVTFRRKKFLNSLFSHTRIIIITLKLEQLIAKTKGCHGVRGSWKQFPSTRHS